MKTEKIVSRAIVGFLFAQAVLYGGSKPSMPTNPPPDDTSSPSTVLSPLSATGVVTVPPLASACPRERGRYGSEEVISNWTARGAYCDWTRIGFPDGFRFPVGTNFIDDVTLFAYGEIVLGPRPRPTMECSNLLCTPTPTTYASPSPSPSTFTCSLPSRVSLEPGVSSVTHGLTPSNSYLFAWTNCCVERSATNRVDATIEFFRSGAVATTVTPLSTNQPPTTIYQPPTPPDGFIGHDQDLDWATNAFPESAAAIANAGYGAWLENQIGHNEPNGLYKVSVTVAALPEDGSPCYLFVGPYRTVVTAPGVYSFPLEVFETYRAYTLPRRIPLSFEYDDGYDLDPRPGPLFMNAPMRLGMSPQEELEYEIRQIPALTVIPDRIERSQIGSTPIQTLCNMANATKSYVSTIGSDFRMTFLNQTQAEIVMAMSDCLVEISFENGKGRATGWLELYHRTDPDPGGTNIVEETQSPTNAPPCEIP